MNKLIISIFTLLMVAVGAMAQTATVTGTVTDDYGPVIGATVIVQGTTWVVLRIWMANLH